MLISSECFLRDYLLLAFLERICSSSRWTEQEPVSNHNSKLSFGVDQCIERSGDNISKGADLSVFSLEFWKLGSFGQDLSFDISKILLLFWKDFSRKNFYCVAYTFEKIIACKSFERVGLFLLEIYKEIKGQGSTINCKIMVASFELGYFKWLKCVKLSEESCIWIFNSCSLKSAERKLNKWVNREWKVGRRGNVLHAVEHTKVTYRVMGGIHSINGEPEKIHSSRCNLPSF